MEKIAKFEKVTKEQFINDFKECFNEYKEEEIEEIYNNIKLPQRATKGSAGYDFYLPVAIKVNPKETVKIPTGIRVNISDGWFLSIFPRSGLGFKYRMQLNNTVGIIDADYYGAKNEGHIQCKITNDSNENKVIELKQGDAFVQGIFMPFGITIDDNATEERTGGFGSTSK